MNNKEKKIKFVVTGMGLVSPLGIGVEKNWARLINGESEILFDPEFNTYTAKNKDITIPENLRQTAMAFISAQEAIKQSEISNGYYAKERIGLSVGESKQNLFTKSFTLEESFSESLKRTLNIAGQTRSVSAACATGALSIIQGCKMIEENICDAVLCATAETSLHPLYIAAFKNMGVLSKDLPKPFDKKRDGFAVGEGGGFLIIEEKTKAILRGAKPLCEISGFSIGMFSENTLTINSYDKMQTIIQKAAKNNIPDYIHMHGTGTKLNDYYESLAVANAFCGLGADKTEFGLKHSEMTEMAKKQFAVSSTKAATGHLLGASAITGAIFAIMSINKGLIPPTLNFKETDINVNLNYTPNKAVQKKINSSMSLSFGFGGQGAALYFEKI